MALALDTATRTALNAGAVSFRYLAKFELDDDTYYFGNHTPGDYISVLGESWYGLGGLAQVSDLRTQSGLAADEATLRLNGTFLMVVPEGYENASSWLRDVLQQDMINRRCTIYELIEQADTGAPLTAIQKFAGPIDRTPLDLEQPELSIRVRSNRQALTWANGRSRSDADQRRIDVDDGSLRHVTDVAARGGKLAWGFFPNSGGVRTGGGGGGGPGGGRDIGPIRIQ